VSLLDNGFHAVTRPSEFVIEVKEAFSALEDGDASVSVTGIFAPGRPIVVSRT